MRAPASGIRSGCGIGRQADAPRLRSPGPAAAVVWPSDGSAAYGIVESLRGRLPSPAMLMNEQNARMPQSLPRARPPE